MTLNSEIFGLQTTDGAARRLHRSRLVHGERPQLTPGRDRRSPRLSMESTLAWQQLDDGTRERWNAVGRLAVDRFNETPIEVRRRWSRTGTSLPNAVLLEQLATEVRAELPWLTDRRDPIAAFTFVSDHDRLARLLTNAGTHAARFRRRRNAPRTTAFAVNQRALIVDWL